MTPEESAVSLAADEADERTGWPGAETGPGVWHRHFLAALDEQGWVLVRKP